MPSGRTRRQCYGFTVVELVLVIGVTSVVSVIAYSAWKTHKVRMQVGEGLAGAAAIQEAVTRAFQAAGEVPASAKEARIASASRNGLVASMTVENGRIDLVYGNHADAAIAGRRLSLTPYETAVQQIVWVCGNEIPGPDLHSLGFSGGGRQALQIPTTIEARYLPPACR
jgi:type IV pilus assembly protein PilA